MEMGLPQSDAAKRLNVSRSVVQRLWDQYQSENFSGRARVTTSAEDRFLALSMLFFSLIFILFFFLIRRRSTTVPQIVADHFVALERRISATTVRRRLHNAGLYARRPVVCVPQRTTEKGPLMLGKRTRFLDQTAMGFCTLHRRVQIHTGERFRASADLEGTTYQIESIQLS
ncbi:hypothetical protein AVEN_178620-1 [Araneus ventricosus]|uniref:Transposase Tc1-like domain-containing protein n=1 Tax=Araneus ventricosus TaxID=182803 RepID=A0A4Y2PMZ3_ARAVE|nr:hypothetical protein AVEN_178620-1 [Araneus ventricosus]